VRGRIDVKNGRFGAVFRAVVDDSDGRPLTAAHGLVPAEEGFGRHAFAASADPEDRRQLPVTGHIGISRYPLRAGSAVAAPMPHGVHRVAEKRYVILGRNGLPATNR
jgi:hypothetical protein